MTKIQYERLQQDSHEAKTYLNLLLERGETQVAEKVQKKVEFIESRLAEVTVAT